jgi:hypothetical protein
VKQNACECHEALVSHYEKIFSKGSAYGLVPPRTSSRIVAQ